MINPFGQQPCPKGGWRYHCGPNCLYKHYDDPDGHTTKFDTAKIADAIHGYHPGYKSKLRSTKTQVHHEKPSKQSATFTVRNTNKCNSINNRTPVKGGGLIGLARSIRRSPPSVQLPTRSASPHVSIDMTDADSNSTINSSNDDTMIDDYVMDDIIQTSQSSQSSSKNALRKKIHNLNGVYGGNKGDYLSTGLRNTGNYCYLIAVLQCIIKCDDLFKMLMNGREGRLSHFSGSLTDELRFLAMVLRSGEYRYVTPNDFRLKVADKLNQFSGNRQHDAHEF